MQEIIKILAHRKQKWLVKIQGTGFNRKPIREI